MRLVIIAAAMLAVIGCSTAPSKLERIEALEKVTTTQGAQIEANTIAIEEADAAIIDTNIKIDRMFEKSQYK